MKTGKLHRDLSNRELFLQQELVYQGYVENMNDEQINWDASGENEELEWFDIEDMED